MAKDINLHESGNGGELAIVSGDLLVGESIYQQVYLALFGGNVEASTRGDELITEIRRDWWGNSLFFKENPTVQFNSTTERTLNNVVLNSSGRLSVIESMNEDLDYLKKIISFENDVFFLQENKIKLVVNFTVLETGDNSELSLIYDNAKKEIIIEKTI